MTGGIANRILARAIALIGERRDNLGAGGLRAIVVRIHVLHADVDTLPDAGPGTRGRRAVRRVESDDAGAQPELGVADAAVRRVEDGRRLEAKGANEPVDGGVSIAIAKRGENVRSHKSSTQKPSGLLECGLGRNLPVGREAAAVGYLARNELGGGHPGKRAEVAGEVRLVVVATVLRDLDEPAAAARLDDLDGAAEAQDARERLGRQADLF